MLCLILSLLVLGTMSCSKDAPVSPPRAGKATADDAASDRETLVAFYKATGGDNWKDNTNWLSADSLASWHGVVTDSEGRVKSLALIDNNLIGFLPPELGQLTKLEKLQLNNNQLTGAIPPELGQLTHLEYLGLGTNQLTGPIPPELGQLTNLQYLSLWTNQLTGLIPPELGRLTNLRYLVFPNNQLTGPIPPELGQLTNLIKLYPGANQLTGAIPPELGQLTHLEYLGLGGNQLTGAIPAELVQLTHLEYLGLGGNQLTGAIPAELVQLTNLQQLRLPRNQLTGPIPAELGQLTHLEYLGLGANQLTGPIPSELGQLTNLIYLDLRANQLTGPIPAELGQLAKLEILELRENPLTGCIPNTLRNLPLSDHFKYADLDQLEILFCGEDDQLDRSALIAFYEATGGDNWRNKTYWLTDAPLDQWHGIDADAFGRVIAIELMGNGLQGAIPPEIKALTSLKDLRLGHNQLTDVTEIGHLTSLTMLMLHHNQLGEQAPLASLFAAFQGSEEELRESGSIPSTFAQLTNLQLLWLQGNQITDISSLANLTTVSELSLALSDNQITDISSLANLTNPNLRDLWLQNNQIRDVSPLENMTMLTSLSLGGNQIRDVSPLENLTNLGGLWLQRNQIRDLSPLENMTILTSLSLGGNQITDLSPLESMTMLTHLWLSDNQITDLSPLLNLMALRELDLWGNPLNSDLRTIHTLQARGVTVLFPRLVESVFDIELVYLAGFSDYQKRKIDSAVQRWTALLTADVPEYEFTSDWQASCGPQFSFEIRNGERIDDLRIYVGFLEPSDYAVGRGWPSLVRANHLPVVGCMNLKPLNISSGDFDDLYFTALHEVGHVLGFGTTWTNNGLLQESSRDVPNGDPHFNGPLAIAAFDEAGGHQYRGAKVPVAGFRPNGEPDNSHWRDAVFGDQVELMTARGGGGLSAITLQSLADLGYSVDLSQADAYTLPAAAAAKPQAVPEKQPLCDVSGRPEPVYVWEIE